MNPTIPEKAIKCNRGDNGKFKFDRSNNRPWIKSKIL
jgi:hypothetical protein